MSEIKVITKGLGERLVYIHSKNIIQRDVKEFYILFTDNSWNPLTIDFGLSVRLRKPTDKVK